MDTWKVKDKIRSGEISFEIGDKVVIFRRKKSGYPKGILDGVEYTIRFIDGDFLGIARHSSDGIGWLQTIKIHRSYMVPKSIWRDWKMSLILED